MSKVAFNLVSISSLRQANHYALRSHCPDGRDGHPQGIIINYNFFN